MGLISLTWVFCHNLVKFHLVVIEILSFSYSIILLVKADGNHPAVTNCKKNIYISKWLNAKSIVTQSWYNSIERFFQFCTLLFLRRGAILADLFLFNLKKTYCKNHFDTNWVKIHLEVIAILSFSCSVLFLVKANGDHLGMPNCKKKSKRLHTRNILAHTVKPAHAVSCIKGSPVLCGLSNVLPCVLLYIQPVLRGRLPNAVSGRDFAHRSIQYPSIKRSVVRQGQALVVKHQKKCPTGHFNILI